jgi:hypothetical protein
MENSQAVTFPPNLFHPVNMYKISQAQLAHTCNLSYLGSRDQKDHGFKPAQGNSSQDPISKKPFTKKG